MKLEDINVGDIVQLDSITGPFHPQFENLDLVVCKVSRGTGLVMLERSFSLNLVNAIWLDYRCLIRYQPLMVGFNSWLPAPIGGLPPVFNDGSAVLLARKCECGSESLGYTTHSHWCNKHEN